MEIEQLKSNWLLFSQNSKENYSIEASKIKEITQGKYRQGFSKVFFLEFLGVLISLYFIFLLLYKFSSFDTLLLKAIAIFTLLSLVVLPSLRIVILKRLFQARNFMLPHFESVRTFMSNEIKFQKVQKLCAVCVFLLVLFLLVLNVKIYQEYDVTKGGTFWGISFFLSIAFAFVYWQYIRRYYNKNIKKALALIKELN